MDKNVNKIINPRVNNVQCVHGRDQEAPWVACEVTVSGVADGCPLDWVVQCRHFVYLSIAG